MKFPPLIHGKLIKRYKRFLADIRLKNGEIVTAHVPNSGAMTSCIKDNCDVYISFHDNPKRKLKYTLELTNVDNTLICVNTNVANKIAYEAIKEGVISELKGYESIRTEQKYGVNSRIDILLENKNEKCYVEVKSVTLRLGNTLAFPDAITTRGTKHLNELIAMKKEGHRAVMLFVIQREDLKKFKIANQIDKTYQETLTKAQKNGVEVLVYQSGVSIEKIEIKSSISF